MNGVLLVNLGTPAAPTPEAVRTYLAEFLGDPRVVEIPRFIWLPILYGLVLRKRPAQSAAKYAKVWTGEGSPLMVHTRRQAALLGAAMAQWVPSAWLNQLLPAVVFACGLYLLLGKTPAAPLLADAPIAKGRQWPQSLSLGFYDGVAGPGTGAFWTVSSLLLYPLDLVRASGGLYQPPRRFRNW